MGWNHQLVLDFELQEAWLENVNDDVFNFPIYERDWEYVFAIALFIKEAIKRRRIHRSTRKSLTDILFHPLQQPNQVQWSNLWLWRRALNAKMANLIWNLFTATPICSDFWSTQTHFSTTIHVTCACMVLAFQCISMHFIPYSRCYNPGWNSTGSLPLKRKIQGKNQVRGTCVSYRFVALWSGRVLKETNVQSVAGAGAKPKQALKLSLA